MPSAHTAVLSMNFCLAPSHTVTKMVKILIIAPNWIGDAVMTEPLISQLKKNNPDSQIDVLATPWVASIMKAIPAVNQIITADFQHGALQWKERKTLAKQLAKNVYTHAYVLPNSFKSALIPWLAKIPHRIGYQGEMRWGLINEALTNPSRSHRPSMSSHYFVLSGNVLPEVPQPQLSLPDAMITESQQALQKIHTHQELYVLCPGAEYGPAKQWPIEHFGHLAKHLIETKQNSLVLILGSKKEFSIGSDIASISTHPDRVINWCGQTSLEDAMAAISNAKAVISNDSGLMHIAAAFRRPQVAIFGSSDPRHTPPLSKLASIHWLHLECSPCFKRTCPLGHLKCLVDIEVKDVLNSVNQHTH
jgi:heptosyltransferase II